MRKYGIHWGLFSLGHVLSASATMIMASPLFLWANSIMTIGPRDCVDLLKEHWLLIGCLFACVDILKLPCIVYRAKKQHAQGKPLCGKDPGRLAAAVTPAALAKRFGLWLLGTGFVAFAVPLYRELMLLPVLLMFTIGIALANTIGDYLEAKAQLPEPGEPVTPPIAIL